MNFKIELPDKKVVEFQPTVEDDMWWGYKHDSGAIIFKKYISKSQIEDAEESVFVKAIVYPFKEPSSVKAKGYIKSMLEY